MRNMLKLSALVIGIVFTSFTMSNAQAQLEPIDGVGGGVVCECNNNHKCVASGGGAVCKNKGDNCWDNDGNCR